jgi:hypothetical protein
MAHLFSNMTKKNKSTNSNASHTALCIISWGLLHAHAPQEFNHSSMPLTLRIHER